jgi:small multidrug resistance pump
MLRKWLLLGGAIGSEVSGSLALKAAIDQPAWYALVAVGYIASFLFLSATLRAQLPLGVAYGIWGAVGVALTALLGALLFGEPLNAAMLAGIALIIGGVLTVEFGSQRAQEAKS